MSIERAGTLIRTINGLIDGVRDPQSGTLHWLGIPYAKPPVGELRWKSPRELEPWEGIRSASAFGNDAVQLINDIVVGDEDCLYLNVWRPDDASTGLPVLVFAHGGGNRSGSGRDFIGNRLAAATNSIVISVNYRLGAMGFFRHPALRTGNPLDDSGNYGLLDIIQALRWVRGNIERFGGDPDKVTLAGQSAGARNVLAALISPCATGLFRRMLILSGGMTTASAALGDTKGAETAAKALAGGGQAETADEAARLLASLPPTEAAARLRGLDAATYARALEPSAIRMAPFPHLFEDGTVIPTGGFRAFGSERALPKAVPVILGSMASEFSMFAYGDPEFQAFMEDGSINDQSEAFATYEAAVRYGTELYAGFNAERAAEWLSQRQDAPPVYAYRFAWGTRSGVIDDKLRLSFGATHGGDVMFYTEDYTAALRDHPEGYITAANEPGRASLAAVLHGYIRSFLHSGDPNGEGLPYWQPWSPADQASRILRLDADIDRAIVCMSDEYFRDDSALAEMDADESLTPGQRTWLRERMFNGRFFWPERP